MIFWHSIRAGTGSLDVIEAYHTLEDAIKNMALLAWEEPGNHWTDYLVDDETGEAVAVAIFGPEQELMVTCADGRRLSFGMPESYRETTT